jgi:hypothetical protein
MARLSVLFVVAAVTLSGSCGLPIDSRGQPSEVPPDDLKLALDDRATEAGTAAGLAEACGSYGTPVDAAFKAMFGTYQIDPAEQVALWQRYKRAESSTVLALAKPDISRCADMNSVILCTIHDLARPISRDIPSENSVIPERC